MGDEDPLKHPFRWFFNSMLLLVFGMVALSYAMQLLSQIWPWVLLTGGIIGGIMIGIAIWRARRQPW